MTPEQQRIAIAEACGWTEIEPCTCCYGVSWGYQPTPGAHKKHVPDYINDLNAMHEAEKVLTNEQLEVYCNILHKPNHGVYWAIHATAAQRAEAFLRTIGKWEEAK
jgi:hypothetical protein